MKIFIAFIAMLLTAASAVLVVEAIYPRIQVLRIQQDLDHDLPLNANRRDVFEWCDRNGFDSPVLQEIQSGKIEWLRAVQRQVNSHQSSRICIDFTISEDGRTITRRAFILTGYAP